MGRPLKLTETVGGTLKVGEIGLTSQSGNQIQASAYIPAADGGSSAVNGSLIKQVSGRRFKVTTAQGTGICKLVATAPGAGEMRVTLTDSASGTYYATKITKHRVQVTAGTGTQFTTGQSVPWVFTTATINVNLQMTSA
jgi:hypothetical protein